MAEPKQKSLELPTYLTRVLPAWQTPQWMEADRWRRVVYNLPVAIDCRDALIDDLVASDWEVRAKNPKEEDTLADDIKHYTDVLSPNMGHAVRGFDPWVEKGGQDLLTLPIGWNNEIVRFPDGRGPLSRPHPTGHVAWIAYIDGATMYPTYDKEFPMAQRIRQDATNVVYFRRDEMARSLSRPRPELERWGYGMPPPEKIYLALTLLFRGDQYYANLLLDTPEAGVLDLMDMSEKSAREWIQSLKTLFEGIDPFKIPVVYEHTVAAKWIPFGRPPTEMMFDTTYLKYAQLVTAGFGLTLTDIGMGDPQRTLAGSIRDERRSRRSGFATTRESVKQMIQNEILPDYLEFAWIVKDEEAQVQRGRAFVLYAQGLKLAKEAGFIKPREGQAQLVKDGHITVEVEPPEENPPPAAPPPFGGLVGKETDRVPASEGGMGDITSRAELGDERIAAAPRDSGTYDQMAQALRDAFAGMLHNADRPRLMRLTKAATRALFPDVSRVLIALSEIEPDWDEEAPISGWLEQRALMWFGEPSEFDEFPDVLRARDDLLEELEHLLDGDPWWAVPEKAAEAVKVITRIAYEEGATIAAQAAWTFLYTEGLTDSPDIIGLNFNLQNPETLIELEEKAALLVRRVNDGTKYYLKRIIIGGVEEGLASPDIARMIQDGADAETVLRDAGYSEAVIRRALEEIGSMTEARINSIVNTEIARAETEGRVGQWQHMGLTRKAWIHTGPGGPNDPCPVCTLNIEAGFVPIDYLYTSVFGEATALGPPAHPQVDHCHIEFDENELMAKAGELEVWLGE